MVTDETPGEDAATSGRRVAELKPLLDEVVEHHRRVLFEPWRASQGRDVDLATQMERTVEALQVFFNKWVVEIIVVLAQRDAIRFNELKHGLGGISSRTLSQRLRDLEGQGLVHREVFDEMPVRVEYSLTGKGRDVAALALPVVLYLTMLRER